MSVQALLEHEYAVLLSHPLVRSVQVVRYIANRLDGYIRARCVLVNGDFLEIALHVSTDNGATAAIDDYRYQWMDSTRTLLRRRWDNAPHFPDVAGAPHHCHVGSEEAVEPSQSMDLTHPLDLIASLIARSNAATP